MKYRIRSDVEWDLEIRDSFSGTNVLTKRSNAKITKVAGVKLAKAEKLDRDEEAIWVSLDGIKDEDWLSEIVTSKFLYDRKLAKDRVQKVLKKFVDSKYIEKAP